MDNTEIKRGPGRPPKTPPTTQPEPEQKRGRGRPRKTEEEKAQTRALREQRKKERAELGIPSGFGQEYVQAGDNAKFLAHAMAVMNMPPIDTADPRQVEQRISDYFVLCTQNDMKPTVKGFCNSLRITRQTLFEWRHGNFRKGTHQEIILRAYDLLEEMWENYMQNGKINPVSGIFLGKNNFHYRDQQEYLVTPNTAAVPDAVDVATIEAKYAELPDCEE